MLTQLRNTVSDYLWINSLRKHRSRMGWREAPRYTEYLEGARRTSPSDSNDPQMKREAENFRRQCWASFADERSQDLAKSMLTKIKAEEAAGLDVWAPGGRYQLGEIYQKFHEVEAFFKGNVGDFLRGVYGTNFKIFYGVCYHSVHSSGGPEGSQLWHADGGPGTCINLMWCLSPVSSSNGAMECLSWNDTVGIFERERQTIRAQGKQANVAAPERRAVLVDYYKSSVDAGYHGKINQPTGAEGLTFAFSNNILHKGGFPQPREERYVCVFHIYPSAVPTAFERYKSTGIPKMASYPADPAFGDVQ